ncbi:MAG: hypothetical protein K2H87_00260 [Duncaniella sp.]|nr:hypothetical protein [Duncaniella sp.]
MSHKTPVQLRFSDLDPLGHVNNTVYFSLMDLAKARYFFDAIGHEIDLAKAGVVVVTVPPGSYTHLTLPTNSRV